MRDGRAISWQVCHVPLATFYHKNITRRVSIYDMLTLSIDDRYTFWLAMPDRGPFGGGSKHMIRLKMARRLRDGGLTWKPMNGDQFVAPDRGMDELVFIINDMAAIVEMWRGAPAVTFHGTPEWALDYLYIGETVWLPHESQLRKMLQTALVSTGRELFDLLFADGVYTCRFEWGGEALAFRAEDAEEAYAAALLYLQEQGVAF
jgi:hypothetical protein